MDVSLHKAVLELCMNVFMQCVGMLPRIVTLLCDSKLLNIFELLVVADRGPTECPED